MQHHPRVCGYYALINLYVLCGIEPPTFEQLYDCQIENLQVDRDGESRQFGKLTPMDQLRLLTRMNFPRFCAIGAIPPYMSAQQCFEMLMRANCKIVPSYNWQQEDGSPMGHNVVIESIGPDGFIVLDSNGGFEDGSLISFRPQFTDADVKDIENRKRSKPHGNRRVLPFGPTVTRLDPFGINSYFLITYPMQREEQ